MTVSPSRAPWTVLLVLVLVSCQTPAQATDGVPVTPADGPQERWFVGSMNGTPLMNLHAVSSRDPAGQPLSSLEMELVITRQLPGHGATTIRMANNGRFWTDDQGRVLRFELDEDANGTATVARGVIADGVVTATRFRLGRSDAVTMQLPAGLPAPLAWDAEYRAVLAACTKPGDVFKACNLAIANGDLLLSRPVYTLAEIRADGSRVLDQVDEAMPGITTRLVLGPDATFLGCTIDYVVLKISVVPAEAAAVLAGGLELDMMKLFTGRGAPVTGGDNLYQLEPKALDAVAMDGFQERVDGRLLVRRTCTATTLDDPASWLKATGHLELDAPELQTWVKNLLADQPADHAQRARTLCGAVRSHIDAKNLDRTDASALETFRSKAGDCTEHATLLCAALRIAGIPARIECGLVYSPRHGGWVGHAWTAAWLAADGRWLHLDAAIPGIDRSHYIGCTGDPDAAGGLSVAMSQAFSGMMGTTITALGVPKEPR